MTALRDASTSPRSAGSSRSSTRPCARRAIALEAFVDDPADTSRMRFCASYLHQVQGTLRMVELYGAGDGRRGNGAPRAGAARTATVSRPRRRLCRADARRGAAARLPRAPAERPQGHPDRPAAAAQRSARGARRNRPERKRAVRARPRTSAAVDAAGRRAACSGRVRNAEAHAAAGTPERCDRGVAGSTARRPTPTRSAPPSTRLFVRTDQDEHAAHAVGRRFGGHARCAMARCRRAPACARRSAASSAKRAASSRTTASAFRAPKPR